MKRQSGRHGGAAAEGAGAVDGGLLGAPVGVLPQVGAVRARQFRALGVGTVGELLLTRPRRYEDRREDAGGEWADAEPRALRVRVLRARLRRWGWRKCILDVEAAEERSGRELRLRWFNMPYLAPRMEAETRLWVFGRLKRGGGGAWAMDAPEFEIEAGEDEAIHRDRIVPVYALGGKLAQRVRRAAVFAALGRIGPGDARVAAVRGAGGEWLDAVRALHFPASLAEAEAARRVLARDEFLVWQTALALRRAELKGLAGAAMPPAPEAADRVLDRCGFAPTGAQRRVFSEIAADLASGSPMNRLLQGDVGSGKTLVAALAMAQAAAAGFSTALMAPTELLARQHQATLRRLFEDDVPVLLLAGADRAIGVGDTPAVWVGTHALFSKDVTLPRLGLVVIDEQHRFGVEQRARLRSKGAAPHLLVMSATPIPRTLGLTLYGDLDVSVLDEKPPLRRAPETRVCRPGELDGVWAFAGARAAEGRQVFVVFPAIQGGAGRGLRALEGAVDEIRKRLRPHRIAVAHGRMDPSERDAAMADFASGRAPILLATTLVEVGIDVPNAAVMIVEHAERFGLAQLHQMRGRVGRGGEPAWCLLVCRADTETARRRLEALARNDDGFRIAEIDFQIRGPGELLGKAQSGRTPFRLGSLVADAPLLIEARDTARAIVAADPALAQPAHAALARLARPLVASMDRQGVDAG